MLDHMANAVLRSWSVNRGLAADQLHSGLEAPARSYTTMIYFGSSHLAALVKSIEERWDCELQSTCERKVGRLLPPRDC